MFCREHVAQLRDHPDLPIAFVAMAPPTEAALFREGMRSPHTFISDPDRRLYHAVGLSRGNLGQMFSLETLRRGGQAWRAGHRVGKPVGDPWQLAGVAVLSPDGTVARVHQSSSAADNVSPETLRAWLSER